MVRRHGQGRFALPVITTNVPYSSHAAGLAGSGRGSLNPSRDTIARSKGRTIASLRLLTLT
eukprot:2111413-Pleurochrysis_carterae.AAC.1